MNKKYVKKKLTSDLNTFFAKTRKDLLLVDKLIDCTKTRDAEHYRQVSFASSYAVQEDEVVVDNLKDFFQLVSHWRDQLKS